MVMFGVYVLVTAELNDRNVCGSASNWSVPMIESTAVSTSAGLTRGILIDHAIRAWPAPSMRAAS
jgi:hypothetical protein